MRLKGNILDIKNKRDSRHQDIELHVNKIEYIMHKKDGKYFQPFELEVELEKPQVLTGDCLARINNSHLEEGEYEFQVYDKAGDEYVLNENKLLAVTMAYDEEAQQNIVSYINYAVTVSAEEFKQLKSDSHKAKQQKKGKGRK